MSEDVFRFKQFSVRHGTSSMKIGVDAVLLGAWAGDPYSAKILDVGTGCGVIALILAHRFPNSVVTGIDIDNDSILEAEVNFRNCSLLIPPSAFLAEFPKEILVTGRKFDLIVSNPPYFQSGVRNPLTPREKARHQDSLSVFSLLDNAALMLEEEGKIAMIFPAEFKDKVIKYGVTKNLHLLRLCEIRDNEQRPVKRIMVEFGLSPTFNPEYDLLTLFDKGKPTEKHRLLCKDLYLKF